MIAAVRGDVQETLRVAWLDPPLEAAAASPVFFTAAWSAIRPNVGKSFLNLCRALRSEAVDAVRLALDPLPDLRKQLEEGLSEGEARRMEESARAAHLAAAKTQIVMHALHRAVRGDRITGTGGEEPPVRRGIPEWQQWMASQPTSDSAGEILEDAAAKLQVSSPPAALRLLGRWPSAVTCAWAEMSPLVQSDAWKAGSGKLRRMVLAGATTLPHPVDLQWTALKARGFSDEDRLELADRLAAYDLEMPIHTLAAAFVWAAFGSPEIGSEA